MGRMVYIDIYVSLALRDRQGRVMNHHKLISLIMQVLIDLYSLLKGYIECIDSDECLP